MALEKVGGLATDEEREAPWLPRRRIALFALPWHLTIGMLLMWDALTGPHNYPTWVAFAFLGSVVLLAGVGLWGWCGPDSLDERDRRIELKATSAAFQLLLIGAMLPYAIAVYSDVAWLNVGQATFAAAFLSHALYCGYMLHLYRRGE